MRTYVAGGIVLSRMDLGEKDRILRILTKECGKLSAVAKGCRKPGSRLAGASEPFTYSLIQLNQGRDLDVLSQADIRESFPNVRCDIDGLAHAIYMLELVDCFVDERQPNPDIFDTLLSSLYVLEGRTDPEITVRHFELTLLDILGYTPRFVECARCESRSFGENVAYSPSLGGLVCPECGVPPNDAIWIPHALSSYIEALRRTQPNMLRDLGFPKGARRDLAVVLKWHMCYRLERRLKSSEFLEQLTSQH